MVNSFKSGNMYYLILCLAGTASVSLVVQQIFGIITRSALLAYKFKVMVKMSSFETPYLLARCLFGFSMRTSLSASPQTSTMYFSIP